MPLFSKQKEKPVKEKQSIGYWDGEPSEAVGITCALIIHYHFANCSTRAASKSQPLSDLGQSNQIDIENLENTLENYARIYKISGTSEEVKDFLCKEKSFKKKFKLQENEEPELFLVFILTHGNKNGKLHTHHKNGEDYFYLCDVYDKIQQNSSLKNALKLLFVSACRGKIIDGVVKRNQNWNTEANYKTVKNQIEEIKMTYLDRKKKTNLDAVRVTVEPNEKNFITFFSSVETTASFSSKEGSSTVIAFCKCFHMIAKDVELEEFLTQIINESDYIENQRGYEIGSTPEIKVMKHRQLTISKVGRESEFYTELSYLWKSNKNVLLSGRKAHFYVHPQSRDFEKVPDLQNILWSEFEFELKFHVDLQSLTDSVSAASEDSDGCVFVCIVTELRELNSEVHAKIDEKYIAIKDFIYPTIGPSTGNWIGKPKIFVFLNTIDTTKKRTRGEVSQIYEETEFSKSGTIHQGLLTLILPQTNSVPFFIGQLKDFTRRDKMEKTTFQEFFFALQQQSTSTFRIKPMIISTLHLKLDMAFPPKIIAKNLTLLEGLTRKPVSLYKLWKKIDKVIKGQAEYTVFIISAYAGWGKSVLAEMIANRAEAENIVAILDLRKNSEFYKALNRTKEYRDLFGTYWKINRKNCSSDMPQFIILDNIDDLIGENLLKMVAQMATDKVSLLISTRPQNKDNLEMHLEGICPVTAISIDTASREKQIDFLHRRIESWVNEDMLEEILNYLDYCGGDDLIEKLGSLEKVASYPKLTGNGNIYELSEHVFDCTVQTVLHRAFGLTDDKSGRFKELRKEHERQLSMLSHDFFMDNTVEEHFLENITVLDGYGITTIIESRVVVLSVTLAAYLCVSQGLISTEEHLKKVQELKHLNILRFMLQCKRNI